MMIESTKGYCIYLLGALGPLFSMIAEHNGYYALAHLGILMTALWVYFVTAKLWK